MWDWIMRHLGFSRCVTCGKWTRDSFALYGLDENGKPRTEINCSVCHYFLTGGKRGPDMT